MKFEISREIGIDAGHRVPTHGSKCKNFHGHRYTIQAICEADTLIEEGVQKGMVLDFGFLKGIMMQEIDATCDHVMILWVDDEIGMKKFVGFNTGADFEKFRKQVIRDGFVHRFGSDGMVIYVMDEIPTAENLARHWYLKMAALVHAASKGMAVLAAVKVWETPNCWAEFRPTAEERDELIRS